MKTDDVTRYLELFESLRRSKRWGTDTTVLRFAALGLSASDLTDPAGELERVADELKRRAGWTGALNSPIRYAVAAMILRRGLRPGPVHENIDKVRKVFRERRFRRGGVQEVLAALILVLQNEGRTVRKTTIGRMQEIMRRWKKDHFWLTGTSDYPMAALHAHRDVPPEMLSKQVETVYEALRSHGFRRGNQLQLASHILSLASGSGSSAARRFRDMAQTLKQSRERAGADRYDELALLTLTSGSPRTVVRALLEVRDELRTARPRPSASISFSLATGLVLSRDVEKSKGLATSRDVAALAAAQAVLDAQAAAMAAMVAVSVATTTATTAASS